MAVLASCYLLLRRGNAIAPDIVPPVRLRRWTAAFFASIALNHIWYMPIMFLASSDDILMTDLVGGMLDTITVIPLAIVVLLTMLQDRRRPLWPVAVLMAPLVVVGLHSVVNRSYALLPVMYAYFLLMGIGLTIYMVRAVRQYGRWLRDNYADLEHKEVWQGFVVLVIMLLVFGLYTYIYEGTVYLYALLVGFAVLVCYLLWRVETLSDLSIPPLQSQPVAGSSATDGETVEDDALSQATHDRIGALLKKHCIDTQLYLQHDLSIAQLAKAIGTNRFYLSQYFSTQGITYNAYVNDLRIHHFKRLYREAVAEGRPFTARQLAGESGYHSYSTFRLAFKQRMGQNVREWMHAMTQNSQEQQK
ncbi:MAG: helix-turn-helix transcriptional regulator [Prevotella sp.]|nr:helix-turn-helix transcriptional regulator [Prevotella sp.]MBQ9656169.1 helix-turn-helix transcriptional regulator [Prevotella sp.]